MRLLSFLARRFRWRAEDTPESREVEEAVVVFLHAESKDEPPEARERALRHSLKHLKWLAGKRGLRRVVLHSFAHLGGESAAAPFTAGLMQDLAARLGAAGFSVELTPFGLSCEWELSVYSEGVAKVWKEI
jgi:hypothetical protein